MPPVGSEQLSATSIRQRINVQRQYDTLAAHLASLASVLEGEQPLQVGEPALDSGAVVTGQGGWPPVSPRATLRPGAGIDELAAAEERTFALLAACSTGQPSGPLSDEVLRFAQGPRPLPRMSFSTHTRAS